MPEQFLDENAAPDLSQAAPQDPSQAIPAGGMQQAVEKVNSGPMGITGEGVAAVEQNPLTADPSAASPEEQAEYEDLFKRVMAMVHDTRENGGKKSLADSMLKTISNSQIPSYIAIGKSAGNAMRLVHENAKRQGKEYAGDVLREVGMDLVAELIDIARESGAVKGVPEEESPEMQKFAEMSALEATKMFGEYLLKTGQADVQGEQQGMMEQMEREATSGALDDWNMQEMDPDALNNAMAQKGGFA